MPNGMAVICISITAGPKALKKVYVKVIWIKQTAKILFSHLEKKSQGTGSTKSSAFISTVYHCSVQLDFQAAILILLGIYSWLLENKEKMMKQWELKRDEAIVEHFTEGPKHHRSLLGGTLGPTEQVPLGCV